MLQVTRLECTRGTRRLFANVSFALAPHTLLEVRGANGTGKTSLLRILCGLLPPSDGKIAWNNKDIDDLGDEYREKITYLGHLNGIKEELTARENLRFAARVAGIPAGDRAIDAALRQLGAQDFRHLPCKALSQGQKRRVALARLCLSGKRPLWILDEPFTALDVGAVALLQGMLSSHLDSGGMLVLTTHQEVTVTAPAVQRVELGN